MMGDSGGVGVTVMLDPLPNRGRTVGLIDKELSGGQGVVAMRLPGRVYRDPRLGLALEDVVAVPPHAKTTFAQTARSHVPSLKRLRGKGGGWGRVAAMRERFVGDVRVGELLAGGLVSDVCVFWVDPVSGVRVKSRPAFVTGTSVVDYWVNSPLGSRPLPGEGQVFALQAAWHQKGAMALLGLALPVVFATQDVFSPHAVTIREVSDERLSWGHRTIDRLLRHVAAKQERDEGEFHDQH